MTEKILNLRPTQFAVGMLEIDEKIKTVEALGKKGLRAFVRDNVVPVVRSPHDELYVVDHHHFLCVCYHLGITKVRVKVLVDLSKRKMSYSQFWNWMHRQKNIYPYCQFGEGPREPLYLPKDIRGLADDPYRSLAWFVRKAGMFENTDRNFAEFQWANFFRKKKLLNRWGTWGFARALVQAVKLAQSAQAKKLPGYDKLGLSQKKKARKKIHRQVTKTISSMSKD